MHHARVQPGQRRTPSLFRATFHIWHRGQFGTIRTFRLGPLCSAPGAWNELNATSGRKALLHTLARQMGLKFQDYRLASWGKPSYLEPRTDQSQELRLSCSGTSWTT